MMIQHQHQLRRRRQNGSIGLHTRHRLPTGSVENDLRCRGLRRAGAQEASALLFCMDDKDFGPDQIAPVAHAFPDAQIFVRANDRRQLLALKHAPIAAAQRELFESSVKLAYVALLRTGIDPVMADRVVEEFRRRDCERLERQMEEGNLHAGKHLSFGGVESQAFDPEAN